MCLVYTSITAPHTTRLHWEDRFVRWFGNQFSLLLFVSPPPSATFGKGVGALATSMGSTQKYTHGVQRMATAGSTHLHFFLLCLIISFAARFCCCCCCSHCFRSHWQMSFYS